MDFFHLGFQPETEIKLWKSTSDEQPRDEISCANTSGFISQAFDSFNSGTVARSVCCNQALQ